MLAAATAPAFVRYGSLMVPAAPKILPPGAIAFAKPASSLPTYSGIVTVYNGRTGEPIAEMDCRARVDGSVDMTWFAPCSGKMNVDKEAMLRGGPAIFFTLDEPLRSPVSSNPMMVLSIS